MATSKQPLPNAIESISNLYQTATIEKNWKKLETIENKRKSYLVQAYIFALKKPMTHFVVKPTNHPQLAKLFKCSLKYCTSIYHP
jgi:hypothetical protein